jgi:hypothetical protein
LWAAKRIRFIANKIFYLGVAEKNGEKKPRENARLNSREQGQERRKSGGGIGGGGGIRWNTGGDKIPILTPT